MISRYDVMPSAPQTDVDGNSYPDVMRFPWSRFKITKTVKEYVVTQNDVDRFDVTCFTEYGSYAYDDLVLWYNGVMDIHSLKPGTLLKFPDKTDLDRFITGNKV